MCSTIITDRVLPQINHRQSRIHLQRISDGSSTIVADRVTSKMNQSYTPDESPSVQPKHQPWYLVIVQTNLRQSGIHLQGISDSTI